MDANEIEKSENLMHDHRNWTVQSGKLKSLFSILTEAFLHYEEGEKDVMLDKVKISPGKTKEMCELCK